MKTQRLTAGNDDGSYSNINESVRIYSKIDKFSIGIYNEESIYGIYGDRIKPSTHPQTHFICERDLNENDLINESIKMHSSHHVLCPHLFKSHSVSFTIFLCDRCCAILKLIVRNYSVRGDFAVHYIFSSWAYMFAGLSTTACAVESINNKRF